MKFTPAQEALINLTSKGTELLKCLSRHDYRTRGFLIISEDDPTFTTRVEDFRTALKFAQQVILK